MKEKVCDKSFPIYLKKVPNQNETRRQIIFHHKFVKRGKLIFIFLWLIKEVN